MIVREVIASAAARAARLTPRAAAALAAVAALYLGVFPDVTSTATKLAVEPAAPAPTPEWRELEAAVARVRAGFRGRMHVYIEDLDSGLTIRWEDQSPVPAASLIKLPLAVALLEREMAGKVSLDDTLVLSPGDKVGGSGTLRRSRSGTRLTVRSLLEMMLQRSDNTATNMLTRLLGLEEINSSCRRQGLAETTMPRYIMDLQARDRDVENYTSAADMARTLKALYAARILDAPRCGQLLEVLKGQQVRDRLTRYLPAEIEVAHKTGLMNDVCHDAGILYGPKHDYVVAVLTEDFPSFTVAKRAIGQVGRLVWLHDRGSEFTKLRVVPAKTAARR